MSQTQAVTLTEFLLARIAEDEQRASLILVQEVEMTDRGPKLRERSIRERVLAECEAKRRILEEARSYSPELSSGDNGEWAFDFTLRALASIYADHPDYREEWTP